MAPDYAKTMSTNKFLGVSKASRSLVTKSHSRNSVAPTPSFHFPRRDDPVNSLNHFNAVAKGYSGKLQECAQQPTDTPRFREECTNALRGFHSILPGLEWILRELGSDNGLAYYDRNNNIETLLKNSVNICKDTMSAVNDLVNSNSVLGPEFGFRQLLPGQTSNDTDVY
ncbi:hypothetical protein AMATHDRAFT_44354 [Amanita thiersii Skay4041]|uniref:Uncharacterized protein n=1 Tax=Amanita thiersii Skay4041 TaxID=703135 RepID=A0A2A9NWG0_9AGAR|nr:hypothetical protein AMATHDRAFT_44354 [Amanita thiersii Skay4041]